jgi:exocyst complex component 4
MRFYDRCFGWYKALVTKAQEQATDPQTLRRSATLALEPGEISNTIKALWAAAESGDDGPSKSEIDLLIAQTDEKSLQPGDIIQDKDTISSLCLLYTSMKWLCVKVTGLRHITQHDTDSGRPNLPRQAAKRWTLMNDPNKATSEDGPVYLPMTQETVQYVSHPTHTQDLPANMMQGL